MRGTRSCAAPAEFRAGSLSPNSVNRIHAVLRRALSPGGEVGLDHVQPGGGGEPSPRPARGAGGPITGRRQPADRRVRQGEPRPCPSSSRLAATTGARRGELCALAVAGRRSRRWCPAHLGRARAGEAPDHREGHKDARRAADDARRRVPCRCSPPTEPRSRRRLRSLGASAGRRTRSCSPTTPMGLNPGDRTTSRWPSSASTRQEGLEGLRLHDLRHFAATTMLVGGVDVRTAAGRLGHAQSSTTLDIYAHFVRAADERAASAIGAALDGAAQSRNESSPATPGR